jgi:predicted nucleic acid-binding protein
MDSPEHHLLSEHFERIARRCELAESAGLTVVGVVGMIAAAVFLAVASGVL